MIMRSDLVMIGLYTIQVPISFAVALDDITCGDEQTIHLTLLEIAKAFGSDARTCTM